MIRTDHFMSRLPEAGSKGNWLSSAVWRRVATGQIGRVDTSWRMTQPPEIFSLSPRGTSGERGRGAFNKSGLLSPALRWGEEGEHRLRPGRGGIPDAPDTSSDLISILSDRRTLRRGDPQTDAPPQNTNENDWFQSRLPQDRIDVRTAVSRVRTCP